MLITAIATMALGFTGPQPPMHCVATLENIKTPAVTMEYAGAIFGTCCGGCDTPFIKDPKGLIAKAAKANKAIGAFEFDPVTGARIDSTKATAWSDHGAIRYFFNSAAEKKSFDANPAKYVGDVKQETSVCPVSGDPAPSGKAVGFADYKGVRYYFCCGDCPAAFKANPAKYAAAAKDAKNLVAVRISK